MTSIVVDFSKADSRITSAIRDRASDLDAFFTTLSLVSGTRLHPHTAGELHGLQVGVYNRARSGAGIQIGLVNGFGPPGDALWLPIVNARF